METPAKEKCLVQKNMSAHGARADHRGRRRTLVGPRDAGQTAQTSFVSAAVFRRLQMPLPHRRVCEIFGCCLGVSEACLCQNRHRCDRCCIAVPGYGMCVQRCASDQQRSRSVEGRESVYVRLAGRCSSSLAKRRAAGGGDSRMQTRGWSEGDGAAEAALLRACTSEC